MIRKKKFVGDANHIYSKEGIIKRECDRVVTVIGGVARVVWELIVAYIFTKDGYGIKTKDDFVIKCKDQ